MKITYYLYNTFIIESGDKKIVIDPGALFFYFFRFTSLIPKTKWKDITHIFVTHGDPDHYWYADQVAKSSSAPIIFNKSMVKRINGKNFMLGPRERGLSFKTPIEKFKTLSAGETIKIDKIEITGIKTIHGPLKFHFGPFSKTLHPGPKERIGWGAIGFKIKLNGKTLVNLGDSLLRKKDWIKIKNPDILMIPIGGKKTQNTMDEKEALEAVKIMKPKLVIPCHYNCPALFSKKYNPSDDKWFKKEIEKLGIVCKVLYKGDSLVIK
jgi:L-ascorbate metabolism protein UlaG (beta-lactamase superfamily)